MAMGRNVVDLEPSTRLSQKAITDHGIFHPEMSHSYEEWRDQFARERLRLLYYLGLIANPVFIAADLLLHREHLHSLIVIRSVLELGLLVVFCAAPTYLSVEADDPRRTVGGHRQFLHCAYDGGPRRLHIHIL